MNCPHGFPSPASCVECMEEGPPEVQQQMKRIEEPEPLPDGEAFEARFSGFCRVCSSDVIPGQEIIADKGFYVHYPYCVTS